MQTPKRKPPKYTRFATDHIMSQEKYDACKKEIDALLKKRPAAAQEVSRLAEMGDFSENVEYQLAKGRLRGINNAITRLEYQLSNAQVIKPSGKGVVELGSTVSIHSNKGMRTYTILGEAEVHIEKGIISHQSPLGAALLGHRLGDYVEVPNIGTFEIVSIE